MGLYLPSSSISGSSLLIPSSMWYHPVMLLSHSVVPLSFLPFSLLNSNPWQTSVLTKNKALVRKWIACHLTLLYDSIASAIHVVLAGRALPSSPPHLPPGHYDHCILSQRTREQFYCPEKKFGTTTQPDSDSSSHLSSCHFLGGTGESRKVGVISFLRCSALPLAERV